MTAGAPAVQQAVFGKWHLSNATVGGDDAPNLAGVPYFEGLLDYPDYFAWETVRNGERIPESGYLTTAQVDAAAAWILTQEAVGSPWLCFLNLSAPHSPWHAPPAGLYTTDLTGLDPDGTPRPFYKAAVEAQDAELGRLLATLGPALDDTTIVFLGDNGTPGEVIAPPIPPSHGKLSLYEGGVRVPLLVAGAAVERAPGVEGRLVSVVDLFPTLGALVGVDVRAHVPPGTRLDGVSFVDALRAPGGGATGLARTAVYAEYFAPNGFQPTTRDQAVRGSRYKLIRFTGGGEELYDLEQDPLERFDLLRGTLSEGEATAYLRLSAELARVQR